MSHYREIQPTPRLARYVECYWHSQHVAGSADYKVLPDGCVDLLLLKRKDGDPISLSVVGLMTTPQAVNTEPGQAFFGVRFHAGMAASFVKESALLTDQTVPVEDILGAWGRSLFERFAESSGLQEMSTVADGLLRP